MRGTAKVALLLMIGVLLGAGASETFHVFRNRHRDEFFQQRFRCRQVAESYVKSNTDDNHTVYLDRADFSTKSNSCIASVDRMSYYDEWQFQVMDILTGETLYTDNCYVRSSPESKCGGGKIFALRNQRNKVFDEAVK